MKKIIIMGASSGLGLELSKVFMEKGYEVIGLSRTKPELAITHIPIDFTDKESIIIAGKKIKEKYSDFSCIISCAGIGYIEKLDNIDFDHSDEMFRVNILGQSYLLSELSLLIKENNADLVFIGATIAYKGDEFMPMYSVTKWGLRGLIENWKLQFKQTSCRVMGIHLGGLNTESNIGENGRGKNISQLTGKTLGIMLDTNTISNFIFSLTQLPKNMEVSEIIINRK
ncbi:SDR family oxidoreductase [Candidatus Gracilibacteria bacterium]|nr:SDR family oxidoreductase [Candidatus Gracilibacteria bacterium]NUJ99426.1 SDR family oxidoreductase [Candidatus Gracilibacteria bacterium]